MKLIIDISEEVKQTFDNAKNEDLYGNYYDRNSLIGKAIQNGIPLDKIKKQIDEQSAMHMAGDFYIRNFDVKWILDGNEVRE
jgi:hypothetical protein